jgi:3'-phosphoadenosine 5'-phosphosulfate sulfotransferase (PAPS reductase)/FAD synthetase
MDLEKKAIERIKSASEMSNHIYGKPLHIAYSGGKDSDLLLDLAIKANVPIKVRNSHTSVDAPETVKHIRKVFYNLELKGIDAKIELPMFKNKVATMWNLIPQKKTPPTRLIRYCCSVLKEQSGQNEFVVTGVRWDESTNRKKRNIFETIDIKEKKLSYGEEVMLNNDNDEKRMYIESCFSKNKRVLNPIIDFKNHDVWDYIESEKIETNILYECGFDRVGCIGCPMAGRKKMISELNRYPMYKQNYIKSFDRMLKVMDKTTSWNTGEDVFEWWIGNDPNQITLKEFMEY